MPPEKKPGPGRYAHLGNLVRTGSPPARWPFDSDKCPECGGQAEFGQPTGAGNHTTGRYALFQCGSCDNAWRADRMPGKPKTKKKVAA